MAASQAPDPVLLRRQAEEQERQQRVLRLRHRGDSEPTRLVVRPLFGPTHGLLRLEGAEQGLRALSRLLSPPMAPLDCDAATRFRVSLFPQSGDHLPRRCDGFTAIVAPARTLGTLDGRWLCC